MQPKHLPNIVSSSIEDDSSIHANADLGSDNETSERPVREKLKNASLASIPKESPAYTSNEDASDVNDLVEYNSPSANPEGALYRSKNIDDSMYDRQLKANRKRSFDDLGIIRTYETNNSAAEVDISLTPTQKRSMITHGHSLGEGSRLEPTSKVPELAHDWRGFEHDAVTIEAVTNLTNGTDTAPSPPEDSNDPEMIYSTLGPRKKRSRNQLDADIDREQKIVATEEARAQRRSEEQERDVPHVSTKPDLTVRSSMRSPGPVSDAEDSRMSSDPKNSQACIDGLRILFMTLTLS